MSWPRYWRQRRRAATPRLHLGLGEAVAPNNQLHLSARGRCTVRPADDGMDLGEMMEELRRRGQLSEPPAFADCQVPYPLGMDFDDSGRLIWMEV